MHHLLKFLYQKEEALGYLQKIISIHQLKMTVTRFYQILDIFNESMKSYVTEVHFQELLMGETRELCKHEHEEVHEFSKIIRVICNKFYKKECYQSIIYSVKLTFESKDLHYIGMRQIRSFMELLTYEEKAKKAECDSEKIPSL